MSFEESVVQGALGTNREWESQFGEVREDL
jgi:hypothetical protein